MSGPGGGSDNKVKLTLYYLITSDHRLIIAKINDKAEINNSSKKKQQYRIKRFISIFKIYYYHHHHHHIQLKPFIVEYIPILTISNGVCFQFVLSSCLWQTSMASVHVVCGRHRLRLFSHGLHSIIRRVEWLSFMRAVFALISYLRPFPYFAVRDLVFKTH